MLLRPAKIFTPLHQLRHFLETKVTELVQQQPTVSSALQNAKTRFYHISAQQQQQVIAKTHFNNAKAPTLFHVAEQEQQRLLKTLQQQFPIVKIFSSPTIARPPNAYQFSFASTTSQQYRTIMSSTTSSGGNILGGQADGFYAAANGFYNTSGCGFFPRTVVGYARTPFATRHFSTAKSPCVSLFQQTTNNTMTNTGFSHISSRFVSPAGSKMSSPFSNGNESHARPSALSNTSNDNDENQNPSNNKAGMFSRQHQCKGMSDLIQEEEAYPNKRRQPGLVRRGSVTGTSRRQRRHHQQRTYNNNGNKGKTTLRFEYIRHDDLSCKYTPQHSKDTAATPANRHHHWHSSRVKAPPDKKEQVPKELTVVYLSFQLDGTTLWNSSELSSSQILDSSLVQSVHSVAELYQHYLAQVVMLLNQLQCHGKFRAILNGNELCVMFPSSEHWPEEDRITLARQWLIQIGIDPDNSSYVVLKEMTLPPEHQQHELRSSNFKDLAEEQVLGPEYFKGIQIFLDHVDDLIETGPAFGRR
ncbi:hypothetical protein BDC45DRAFT_564012 [Circinella umbellata]|nr:hypothetical protein BDC45DRAFT_564012 [Circinella umbellata]